MRHVVTFPFLFGMFILKVSLKQMKNKKFQSREIIDEWPLIGNTVIFIHDSSRKIQ
jgi:hypothetical protein